MESVHTEYPLNSIQYSSIHFRSSFNIICELKWLIISFRYPCPGWDLMSQNCTCCVWAHFNCIEVRRIQAHLNLDQPLESNHFFVTVGTVQYSLDTREGRNEWERRFNERFIQPVLQVRRILCYVISNSINTSVCQMNFFFLGNWLQDSICSG